MPVNLVFVKWHQDLGSASAKNTPLSDESIWTHVGTVHQLIHYIQWWILTKCPAKKSLTSKSADNIKISLSASWLSLLDLESESVNMSTQLLNMSTQLLLLLLWL